jgi:predicted ATP-dependent endonuclease of OLD family
MYEVLRFNPFICESFYSDEVILIEWPTEEIILRWYLSEKWNNKDLFIVNCWTVNNIPFYQKVFSKFSIKYHIICDTDNANYNWFDENWMKKFSSWIQKTIYEQYLYDRQKEVALNFFYHEDTFEPAHNNNDIPKELRFVQEGYNSSYWKPYNANLYWKNILSVNLEHPEINKVPIIRFINSILEI